MTTIGRGEFIADYASLIERGDAADRTRLVIVPDRKTAPELYEAARAAERRGLRVVLPSLDEQEGLLARLGAPGLIPFDSDNRRNVGYLLAWMSGADYIVSIDDDNLPTSADLLARHAVVTEGSRRHDVVSSPSGWFNPCELLEFEEPGVRVFARGFPYSQRDRPPDGLTRHERDATVRINAGLWVGEPDVDAVTRLAVRPTVTAARAGAVVLDRDTWAPVNSQNTGIHRDAIPAYYFVRMGYRLFGSPVDRFGDIFSGYFVQACAKHLGHAVRFGDPVTNHLRNHHAVLRDLALELPGILAIEHLVDWLRECRLEGSTYMAAYRSLSHALDDVAERLDPRLWTPEARGFLHQTAHLMRQWLDVLTRAVP